MAKSKGAKPKVAKSKVAKSKVAKSKAAKSKAARSKVKKGAKRPAKRGAAKAARSFSRPAGDTSEQTSSWFFPARKPGDRWYWLLKQEPTDFSFDDLMKTPGQTTNWNGVRNFLARNFLRDRIKTGDRAFFYHSNANPSAIVGIVDIVRDGYPDASALDAASPYYDAEATRSEPRWFQVDVRAVAALPRAVSIADIKADPALASLVLLHISQLSVQPVTKAEWEAVLRLAQSPEP